MRDAHDRYANIEIAYLLQKMEEYEGVAILATNLRQNLDEAFVRRLSFIDRLPVSRRGEPAAGSGGRSGRADVPLGDDVDLGFLARTFRADRRQHQERRARRGVPRRRDDGAIVQTIDLVRATRREFQKMGKTMPYGEPGAVPDRPAHQARTRALSS